MSPTQLGPTEPAGTGAAAAAVYALEGGFPRTRLLAEGPLGTGDCRCGRPPLGIMWPSRCVPGVTGGPVQNEAWSRRDRRALTDTGLSTQSLKETSPKGVGGQV